MRLSTAVLLAATLLSAEAPLRAQSAAGPDFRPLEFLVGSCWTGGFPDGKQTDQHCFEWMFDRKFIRDRHVVRGGGKELYKGETIYAWNAKERRLGYSYWNSEGMVITGTVENTPDGVVFPSQYTTEKGMVDIKAIWTRPTPDSYRVVQQQRGADGWRMLWTMDLKRER